MNLEVAERMIFTRIKRKAVLLSVALLTHTLCSYVLGLQSPLTKSHDIASRKPNSPRYDKDETTSPSSLPDRRNFLHAAVGMAVSIGVVTPSAANAGEVGARINRAVTQSDLGISVRRSVVKGAQVMDGIDGQWERFSDKYGLGEARKGQPGRPTPKVIPDPQPLDSKTAMALLSMADDAFVQVTHTNPQTLQNQIRKVQETVAPSFARAGMTPEQLAEPSNTSPPIIEAPQFNFLSYSHFKAYSDIIIDQKIDFRTFKKAFEDIVGQQTTALLISPQALSASSPSPSSPSNSPVLLQQFNTARDKIDQLAKTLVDKGLVAQVDIAPLQDDLVQDWVKDLSDLQWSIALDGDITQNAQILLQEQGFRLTPSFARCAVQTLLSSISGQTLDISDYYMDTDYNSDPDKFEVKEILLNVVLESA